MITHTYRILIGASGWLHPAWQGGFYPDDLPEDWQLAYCSNEFPVLLMPAEYWPDRVDDIQDWLADSQDSLSIVCEVPLAIMQQPVDAAVEAVHNFIDGLSILGEHCIGVLLPVGAGCPDVAAIILRLDSRLPLSIEFAADMPVETAKAVQKICVQQGIGWCWHGQGPAEGLRYGSLAMTRINSQGLDLRQLRLIVETLLQTTTEKQNCVLIFDGAPPDIETIRHTGVILDLF